MAAVCPLFLFLSYNVCDLAHFVENMTCIIFRANDSTEYDLCSMSKDSVNFSLKDQRFRSISSRSGWKIYITLVLIFLT